MVSVGDYGYFTVTGDAYEELIQNSNGPGGGGGAIDRAGTAAVAILQGAKSLGWLTSSIWRRYCIGKATIPYLPLPVCLERLLPFAVLVPSVR